MPREPDNSPGYRREHLKAFLGEVLLNGPIARKDIAPRIGVKAGSITRIARPAIGAGLVRERMEQPGELPVRPGRRFQPLSIDPRGGQVLGIVISPGVQAVALADIALNVIEGVELRIERVSDADRVLRRIALESRRLIGRHVEDRSRLLGGYLMVTAVVDPMKGEVLRSPYLGWGHVAIRARLDELLNLPVQVRMLLPTIAQAEVRFGVARGRGNLLAALCGLGIGVAVLLDGRPIGDSLVPTGPIGVMRVVGEDGVATTLDDLAGGAGVLRRLDGELRLTPETFPQVDLRLHEAIKGDRAGDPAISAEMARAGRALGRLAVQQGYFVRPEAVLVAGPLAAAPSYMAAIREMLDEETQAPVEVIASRVLGAEGGWWASCAMAAWEYLVERPPDLAKLGPLPG
ncbi:MAG: ROK family protein [Rhodospirillales bacterium]|nr:ROK family protein [Rhodospirillales bacterium]